MKTLSHQTQMGLASIISTVAVALLLVGFMGMAQHIKLALIALAPVGMTVVKTTAGLKSRD